MRGRGGCYTNGLKRASSIPRLLAEIVSAATPKCHTISDAYINLWNGNDFGILVDTQSAEAKLVTISNCSDNLISYWHVAKQELEQINSSVGGRIKNFFAITDANLISMFENEGT